MTVRVSRDVDSETSRCWNAAVGRIILVVMMDRQSYDSLGGNGGTIARTPVVDRRLVADVYDALPTECLDVEAPV